MDRCVNCGIATNHCNSIGRRPLDNEIILTVFQLWLAPKSVSSSDIVCQACWDLAKNPYIDNKNRQLGHRNVCLRCGRSLASRANCHQLHTNTTREARIHDVIQSWIIPQTVEATSKICHNCWVAADRAAKRMASASSTSFQEYGPQEVYFTPVAIEKEFKSNQTEPTIVLPDYTRAIETQSKCFITGCTRKERHRVPLSIRKMLLNQYKYYVPENNRICEEHLRNETWHFLDTLRSNYVQSFTAKYIQDMMALKDVVDCVVLT